MAPKKSKSAKAEEQAEDAGVELQQAAPKDKSKVPGGKAGGAASGETRHIQSTSYSYAIGFRVCVSVLLHADCESTKSPCMSEA